MPNLGSSSEAIMTHACTSTIQLQIRDENIKCFCDPGTLRLADDIFLWVPNSGPPCWVHRLCKPYPLGITVRTRHETSKLANYIKSVRARAAAEGHPVQFWSLAFVHLRPALPFWQSSERPGSLLYICEGPCQVEIPLQLSYFQRCKKCLTWQHQPCQLYGHDTRDVGGPVCNTCYVDFLVHYDDYKIWQHMRLLRAAVEAPFFLNNPRSQTTQAQKALGLTFLNQVRNKYGLRVLSLAKNILAPQIRASIKGTMPITKNAIVTGGHAWCHRLGVSRKTPLTRLFMKEIQEYRRKNALARPVSAVDDRIADVVETSGKAMGSRELERRNLIATRSRKIVHEAELSVTKGNLPHIDSVERLPGAPIPGSGQDAFRSVRPSTHAQSYPRIDPTATTKQNAIVNSSVARKPRQWATSQSSVLATLTLDDDDEDIPLATLAKVLDSKQRQAPPAQGGDPKPNKRGHHGAATLTDLSKPATALSRPSASYASSLPKALDPTFAIQRAEVLDLGIVYSWQHYVELPALTHSQHHERHSTALTEPVPRSPPPLWSAELRVRLEALFLAADSGLFTRIFQPVMSAWPRSRLQFIQAVRDLAQHVLQSGRFRGRRAQLGLLLEVLGWEPKGTIWGRGDK